MTSELITFNAKAYGGIGNIQFSDVEGLPDQTLTLDTDAWQSFISPQTTGLKTVTISGTAPMDGKIVVEIKTVSGHSLAITTFTGVFIGEVITYDVETNNTGPW